VSNRQTGIKVYSQFQPDGNTDPRIILIKLADRLDNLREIAGKNSPRKRQMKAVQTMEVFSNLAKLMGEDGMRNELSDLAFQEIDPRRFNYIVDVLMRAVSFEGDVSTANLERYSIISNALEMKLQKGRLQNELNGALSGMDIRITVPGIYGIFSDPYKTRHVLAIVLDMLCDNWHTVERCCG